MKHNIPMESVLAALSLQEKAILALHYQFGHTPCSIVQMGIKNPDRSLTPKAYVLKVIENYGTVYRNWLKNNITHDDN